MSLSKALAMSIKTASEKFFLLIPFSISFIVSLIAVSVEYPLLKAFCRLLRGFFLRLVSCMCQKFSLSRVLNKKGVRLIGLKAFGWL